MEHLRLGVNIDHVATIRNARGGEHPDPLRAAIIAQEAGADGITAHLREDRRHIKDDDMAELKSGINLPLNFEMAATDEMLEIVLRTKPNAACIVPEKREEITTEGGLDVVGASNHLPKFIQKFQQHDIRVSLFIEASKTQIDAAVRVGADIIELHTGAYAHAEGEARQKELERIREAAYYAHSKGLEVHAGHGLNYETVKDIAAIPEIVELNIGHFLIGEAVFVGLEQAIKKMRALMDEAREEYTKEIVNS